MKTYTPKNLFEVLANDRQRIIVKSDPDHLELLVKNNLIYEWQPLTIHRF